MPGHPSTSTVRPSTVRVPVIRAAGCTLTGFVRGSEALIHPPMGKWSHERSTREPQIPSHVGPVWDRDHPHACAIAQDGVADADPVAAAGLWIRSVALAATGPAASASKNVNQSEPVGA